MLIYWVCCFLSIGAIHIVKRIRCRYLYMKQGWLSAFICSLPLFLLSALRYEVGSDYVSYREMYHIVNNSDTYRYEILYTELNRLVYRIGLSFQWVIILTSFLFLILIYKRILDDSSIPDISVFLLLGMCYFFQSTNIIRQILACAVCVYSIKYIEQKKWIKFLVAILIAFGFHKTAFIFLPAYIIYHLQIKTRYLLIAFVMIFLLAPYISSFVSFLVISTGFNHGYYLTYFTYTGTNRSATGLISLAINVLIYIFGVIYLNKDDVRNNGYMNLQYIAVLLSIFNGMFPMINRIRFFYGITAIILIPRILKCIRKYRLKRVLYTTMIMILFMAYSVYIEGISNQSGAVPYVSVFMQEGT